MTYDMSFSFALKYLYNPPIHVPSICPNLAFQMSNDTGCSVRHRYLMNRIFKREEHLDFDKFVPVLTQNRNFEISSVL